MKALIVGCQCSSATSKLYVAKHTLLASDIISSELDKLFHESLASWCGDSGFIPRGSISQKILCPGRIPGSESSDPAGINNFLPVLLSNGRPDPHSEQKTLVNRRSPG